MADSRYSKSSRIPGGNPGPFPSTRPHSEGKIPPSKPDSGLPSRQTLAEAIEELLAKELPNPGADISPTYFRYSCLELAAQLQGTILFPGCKAYEQAIFIGNLLYSNVTPAAIVQAVTVEDVIATVNFIRKIRQTYSGMSLTVKSGGHSMAGYCLNDKGVVLDIGSMNDVKLSEDHKTVTVAGGAVWWDVYSELRKQDLQLVAIGGNCPTVGVSAYLLGGGVSPFSRCYGLGIDSLVKMTIITADGKKVTVSEKDEDKGKKDLFWAVRGGGGGNFGVTVEVEIRVHPLRNELGTVVGGNLTWNLDLKHEKERFDAMMKVWNETTWPDEVRGDALWRYDDNFQLLGQMTIVFNGDKATCDEKIKSLLNFRPSKNELAPMHWTEWESVDGKTDVLEKIYHHHASFIFEQGKIDSKVTEIIGNLMRDKFVTENEDVQLFILWHHIGAQTEKRGPKDTAFFWRKGNYVFHLKVLWTVCSPESKVVQARAQEVFDFVNMCKAKLGPFSLDGKAAYLNYIDGSEANWAAAYYGDNYRTLCDIKKKWDPNNFFHSPQGINPPKDNAKPSATVHGIAYKDWAKYVLAIPNSLRNPKITDEAFSMAAAFRRHSLMSDPSP